MSSTTVEDLVIQALSRAMEFGNGFPTTRSVLYHELGHRQQQLFAIAARWNREYFGDDAIGTLDGNGAIDAGLMGDPLAADPVEAIEAVSKVTVEDPGTSGYAIGEKVHIVSLTDDEDAEIPPRMTYRGNIFRQVGTDLAGVVSIRVSYSQRPFVLGPSDKDTLVVLPEPFHDLLIVNLVQYLVRKTGSLAGDARQAALAVLDAEEKALMEGFESTVRGVTMAVEAGRFGRTTGATKQ